MGFGDVKLMGAIGLFFGWRSMIVISVLSFLIGAILSIALIVSKKKSVKDYIPFGPFIVISTFIMIFVPLNVLIIILFRIFTLGGFKG